MAQPRSIKGTFSHREKVARKRRMRATRPTISSSATSWSGLPSPGATRHPLPVGEGNHEHRSKFLKTVETCIQLGFPLLHLPVAKIAASSCGGTTSSCA
jgi:hypothetical protein